VLITAIATAAGRINWAETEVGRREMLRQKRRRGRGRNEFLSQDLQGGLGTESQS
jgi:hypothetical protein